MYRRKNENDESKDKQLRIGGSTNSDDNNTNSDHYNPTLRWLQVARASNGSLGFNLTRTKWDPYPWVSSVEANTPAKFSGLKVGNCVLEVNGEDVLGLRVSDIAAMIKAHNDMSTSLLVWSPGCDVNCYPESICCGPMPMNLERLVACTQTIVKIIECPVCLNTITPPVVQCQNGHILCVSCRVLSQFCPVCRERFYPGRSLIAEQIYNTIIDTFNLRNQDKWQTKLFGVKSGKRPTKNDQLRCSSNSRNPPLETNKFEAQRHCSLRTNKFLSKLFGKAYSMYNLDSDSLRCPVSQWSNKNTTIQMGKSLEVETIIMNGSATDCSNTDRFDEHVKLEHSHPSKGELQFATISKQLSLSAYDLSKKDNERLMAVERCPSVNRLNYLRSNDNLLAIVSPSITTPAECVPAASSTVDRPVGTSKANVDDNPTNSYVCPYGCGSLLSESTLQQHVKVDHSAPVLCYGDSSAEFSLPLRAPLDKASVLLICNGKDFWIKLRTPGDGSIIVSALLQGSKDESSNFLMETRLWSRSDKYQDDNESDVVAVVNNDEKDDDEKDDNDDGILERELLTRSIVRSMMATTWEDTQRPASTNGCSNEKRNGVLYNRNTICMTFGDTIDYRNLLLAISIKCRY